MPYEMIEQEGQYCVRKIGEDDPMECYDNEEDAQDYLVALEIATQDESKELPEKVKEGRRLKTQWLKKLSELYSTIGDMLTWAKREDEEDWKTSLDVTHTVKHYGIISPQNIIGEI